jgi:chorismate mutase
MLAELGGLDEALLTVWQLRRDLAAQIGRARLDAGLPRWDLPAERALLARYRLELGADGTALAHLALNAAHHR